MTTSPSPPLAEKAADTSRENPWPVRALAQRMSEYIARAPAAWIEGEVAQVTARPGTYLAYLTLRDAAAEISMQVTCTKDVLAALDSPLREGARIVVHGKYDFWVKRGTLGFKIDQIHHVGLGELLARLEKLRRLLAAEGLTSPDLKKPIPFLPRRIGLITGRGSAAEKDVLVNARGRWPAADFEIRTVAVQGNLAVGQVTGALAELDAMDEVDVIVLARGGGSVEDLLPFSDETLCRAVVACRTPVVSAIGHETDHPIVDDVADLRCSTPTDAGKRVVPDVAAERGRLDALAGRARRALAGWVTTQYSALERLAHAPKLRDPLADLAIHTQHIQLLADRARANIDRRMDRHQAELDQLAGHIQVLGPGATLARGYAVVQCGGQILRRTHDAPAGTELRIRLADGAVGARSTGPLDDAVEATKPGKTTRKKERR